MDAARVARAGHDGLRQGKTLVIPGLRNRFLAFGVRLTPRALATRSLPACRHRRQPDALAVHLSCHAMLRAFGALYAPEPPVCVADW